jgi:hypothetical protein
VDAIHLPIRHPTRNSRILGPELGDGEGVFGGGDAGGIWWDGGAEEHIARKEIVQPLGGPPDGERGWPAQWEWLRRHVMYRRTF